MVYVANHSWQQLCTQQRWYLNVPLVDLTSLTHLRQNLDMDKTQEIFLMASSGGLDFKLAIDTGERNSTVGIWITRRQLYNMLHS